MNHKKISEEIIKAVGGADNIKSFQHCATRLRMILSDDSKVDKEACESIEGGKGYFFNTGQHQFIIGTGDVNKVFTEMQQILGKEGDGNVEFKEDVYSNLSPVQKAIRILADILLPLIPVLVTTGLLMGIRGLLINLGVEMSDGVLAIFQLLTDTAFIFLPALVAWSAAKKFGGNPILGIVVGLMLVGPQLPNAWDVVFNEEIEPLIVTLFGFDFSIVGYQGSILPAMAAGWMVATIEKKLRNVVPAVLDLIVTPFVSITVTILLMLFIFGPMLQSLEHLVTSSILVLIELPLGIGYMMFGALNQVLTVTGLHHAIGLIELQLLAEEGVNVLNPLISASMAGQFGAGVSLALLYRNKVKRANALSATSATLFGITEPVLFGVNLQVPKAFAMGMIGGAVGGLVTYILGLTASGMGITFIPGLLLYTESAAALFGYLAVIASAFITSFILVKLFVKIN